MNFESAMDAHLKWKVRLRTFIDNGTENLDTATVAKDNVCDLGKWLHGEGAQYRSDPAYAPLLTEHANFHQCAAAVVKKARDGHKDAAVAMLEARTPFAEASTRTVSAIRKLRISVEKR